MDKYHAESTRRNRNPILEVLKNNKRIGLFIGDYFARKGKRSGAWCSTFKSQSKIGGQRVNPIVLNVCNFSKPKEEMPCLLTLDEAKTLFHEKINLKTSKSESYNGRTCIKWLSKYFQINYCHESI